MNNITQELIAEKELLSDPSRWTKGHLARDASGVPIDYFSKSAVCWCQTGASYSLNSISETRWLKNTVAKTYGVSTAMDFNDRPNTTHEMLMKFYDECIEESKRFNWL